MGISSSTKRGKSNSMRIFNFLIRAITNPGNVKVDYAEDFDNALEKAYRQKGKANQVDIFVKSGRHLLKITKDGEMK